MNKQFIPCKLAIELKLLSFNEECIGAWLDNEEKPSMGFYLDQMMVESYSGKALAPMYQQAFDFFLREFDLFPEFKLDVTVDTNQLYSYRIVRLGFKHNEQPLHCYMYTTPEKAREAAIKELIKIIKESK